MRINNVFLKLRAAKEFFVWRRRSYEEPSPTFIKHACLLRNGFTEATWVETGTFLGSTTKVLARNASFVYSVEPEPTLFLKACEKLARYRNVEILRGTSEELLPEILRAIKGDVNFWLDGHYSAGKTYRGSQETPVLDELEHISRHLEKFSRICVMVDDVRCFRRGGAGLESYPHVRDLINWAEDRALEWKIEHDIFIAKTPTK